MENLSSFQLIKNLVFWGIVVFTMSSQAKSIDKLSPQVPDIERVDFTKCSDIDLSSALPPIRDQDKYNANWCYAMTAADLFSQALHRNISAEQMLWEYKSAYPGKSLLDPRSDDGILGAAVNAAISRGQLCTEKELPLSNTATPDQSILDSRTQTENEIRNRCKIQASHFYKAYIPKKSVPPNGLKWSIDSILRSGRIVAIRYPVNLLMKDKPKQDAWHFSSIVGSQKVNGKCQYKVRNSWGPDCKKYPSPYDKQCVGGNIWIDQDVLIPLIDEIHYLPVNPPPRPPEAGTDANTVS